MRSMRLSLNGEGNLILLNIWCKQCKWRARVLNLFRIQLNREIGYFLLNTENLSRVSKVAKIYQNNFETFEFFLKRFGILQKSRILYETNNNNPLLKKHNINSAAYTPTHSQDIFFIKNTSERIFPPRTSHRNKKSHSNSSQYTHAIVETHKNLLTLRRNISTGGLFFMLFLFSALYFSQMIFRLQHGKYLLVYLLWIIDACSSATVIDE